MRSETVTYSYEGLRVTAPTRVSEEATAALARIIRAARRAKEPKGGEQHSQDQEQQWPRPIATSVVLGHQPPPQR